MRRAFGLHARWAASQSGAAAVEFALVLPVVVMLYVGLIDTSDYVSVSRKVNHAATSLANLAGRSEHVVSPAALDDAIAGAQLTLQMESVSAASFSLRNYRTAEGSTEVVWSRSSGAGPDCPASEPDNLDELTASGNDVIVAAVCARYSPPLGGKIGNFVFGSSTMTIRTQVASRPRESDTLDCPDCAQ
jgi:Flp pilus assembly protein TadG